MFGSAPQIVEWSKATYWPDGPWHVRDGPRPGNRILTNAFAR